MATARTMTIINGEDFFTDGKYILRESADDVDGTFTYRINYSKFARAAA